MDMDAAHLTALRLAKEGFGTPDHILSMPTDLVMDALDYTAFRASYEETHLALNRKDA